MIAWILFTVSSYLPLIFSPLLTLSYVSLFHNHSPPPPSHSLYLYPYFQGQKRQGGQQRCVQSISLATNLLIVENMIKCLANAGGVIALALAEIYAGERLLGKHIRVCVCMCARACAPLGQAHPRAFCNRFCPSVESHFMYNIDCVS